jgi:hypothetical protein
MALLMAWSALVGPFIEPQNCSSLVCSPGFLFAKLNSHFPLDALPLSSLIHIQNDENLQSILEHLKRDEFVKHDYSDCLRPEYTIPGLIASWLDASCITAKKPSYVFQSDNKSNTEESVLGSKKYVPPSVTPQISCQIRSRIFTKLMLLPRAFQSLQSILISRS